MTEQINHKSPALAAMMAYLTMPKQYAEIMQESILRVNDQCPVTVVRIDK